MKKTMLLATALLGMGAAAALASEGRGGAVEVNPFVAAEYFGHESGYKPGFGGGLRLGYFITDAISFELGGDFIQTKTLHKDVGAEVFTPHADLMYNFYMGDFMPFIGIGGGASKYSSDNIKDYWKSMAEAEVGFRYFLVKDVALRGDLRVPVVFDETDVNVLASLGLSFFFGGSPVAPAQVPAPAAAAIAPAPKPVAPTASVTASPDSIMQGASSKICWKTTDSSEVNIAGIGNVDQNGCKDVTPAQTTDYMLTAKGQGGEAKASAKVTVKAPPPPAPKAPEPPADADKDGVIDANDKCPGTPAGVRVDATGCPLDTDKDGVIDASDKCPDTAMGVKVDASGCPLDSDKDGIIDSNDKCPDTAMGVKVDASGCPLDSDKDGVIDASDKCPDTPAGAKVDAAGCPLDSDKDGVFDYADKCPGTPAGAKVDANGCPIDTDKDGVADYADKCIDTPANVKVNAEGCPLDGDKDGVPDYLDKCPTTPSGVPVDATGCNLKKVSMTLKVEFDTGKSDIKPEYVEEITKAADFLKKYTATTCVIEGHTDSTGNADMNKKLSQSRAEAVRNYMVEKLGVPADRISAKGFGPDKPVADNKTPEGRKLNRRIEASMTTEIKQ